MGNTTVNWGELGLERMSFNKYTDVVSVPSPTSGAQITGEDQGFTDLHPHPSFPKSADFVSLIISAIKSNNSPSN